MPIDLVRMSNALTPFHLPGHLSRHQLPHLRATLIKDGNHFSYWDFLMRAANFLLGSLRIFFWLVLFLTLSAGMALGVAYALALIQDSSITHGSNLYLGLVCGLIVWLFMAVFHLRRETLHLPMVEEELFLSRLKEIMHELGYELTVKSPEHLRFHPAFAAFLLGGDIRVKLEPPYATLTGPRVNLEILRNRLRMENYLDKVQQSCQGIRRRRQPSENLLKRVQMTVRLPPNGWGMVVDHLQKTLAKDTAMIGDLHILLQSDAGIPESLIEEDVRQWLNERAIVVDIQKNHVKMKRLTNADLRLPPLPEEVPV